MRQIDTISPEKIKADLRRCYTRRELDFMLHSNNIDEVGHLLRAYDVTWDELKEILADM
jgi:hypothetical protein